MHEFEDRIRAARPAPPSSDLADQEALRRYRTALGSRSEKPRTRGRAVKRSVFVLAAVLACASAAAVVSRTEILSSGDQAAVGQATALSTSGEVAVWGEVRGSQHVVVSELRDASGTWSTERVLTEQGSSPAVAGTGAGSAVAAWVGQTGVESSSLDGLNWSAPSSIPGSGGGKIIKLRLAFGASGTVEASWEQIGVPQRALTATYWDGRWTKASRLPQPDGTSNFAPVVAEGPDGVTVAVWQALDGRDATVNASFRTAEGWGPATALTTARSAGDADVGFDLEGRAYAVWSEIASEGEPGAVMLSVWGGQTGWETPSRVSTAGLSGYTPKVVGLASGALVAWAEEAPGSPTLVRAAFVGAGGRPEAATTLSDASGIGPSIALASSSDGRGAVVWTRRLSSERSAVEASLVGEDQTFGEVTVIPSDGFALLPSATLTSDADLLVLWTETRPDRSVVRSAVVSQKG